MREASIQGYTVHVHVGVYNLCTVLHTGFAEPFFPLHLSTKPDGYILYDKSHDYAYCCTTIIIARDHSACRCLFATLSLQLHTTVMCVYCIL